MDWELHRRTGFCHHFISPIAAIDDTEVEANMVTLAVLAARYRSDGRVDVARVADFLDRAAASLRDEIERADLRR